jgi:hypothetical protein
VLPEKWLKEHPDEPSPVFSPYYQMFRFVFVFRNMVDLACIIRILNVLTVMENIYVMTKLMELTLRHCAPVLLVFLFFTFLLIIFFGCIIYIVECGTFTVNEDYPNGAYLRLTTDQSKMEVSPYSSIAVSFYWVIVTGKGGLNTETLEYDFQLFVMSSIVLYYPVLYKTCPNCSANICGHT